MINININLNDASNIKEVLSLIKELSGNHSSDKPSTVHSPTGQSMYMAKKTLTERVFFSRHGRFRLTAAEGERIKSGVPRYRVIRDRMKSMSDPSRLGSNSVPDLPQSLEDIEDQF